MKEETRSFEQEESEQLFRSYNLQALIISISVVCLAVFYGYVQKTRAFWGVFEASAFPMIAASTWLVLFGFLIYSAQMVSEFKKRSLPKFNAMAYTILGLWTPQMNNLYGPSSLSVVPMASLLALCFLLPVFWLSYRYGTRFANLKALNMPMDLLWNLAVVLWLPCLVIGTILSGAFCLTPD